MRKRVICGTAAAATVIGVLLCAGGESRTTPCPLWTGCCYENYLIQTEAGSKLLNVQPDCAKAVPRL